MTSGLGSVDRRCSVSLAFPASVLPTRLGQGLCHRPADQRLVVDDQDMQLRGLFHHGSEILHTQTLSVTAICCSLYAISAQTTLDVLCAVQDRDQSAGIGFARPFRVLHLERLGPHTPAYGSISGLHCRNSWHRRLCT